MQHFKRCLRDQSLTAPDGLMHILLHHGSNRREVYKAMYGQIVYGAKLAKPGTTLVFPEEIRSVVRERFPDAEAGAYDAQYDKSEKNLHLTLRQCVELKWRSPPAGCKHCKTSSKKPY